MGGGKGGRGEPEFFCPLFPLPSPPQWPHWRQNEFEILPHIWNAGYAYHTPSPITPSPLTPSTPHPSPPYLLATSPHPGSSISVALLGVAYFLEIHHIWYFILVQLFGGAMQVCKHAHAVSTSIRSMPLLVSLSGSHSSSPQAGLGW